MFSIYLMIWFCSTKQIKSLSFYLFTLLIETIECTSPDIPENGWKSGKNYTVGTAITFGCNAGYRLDGASRITCLSDGQWSNNSPRCLRGQCSFIPI